MCMVKAIAVVDDMVQNRQAAISAINEKLPGVAVYQFSSATEFLAALNGLTSEIDLVLSDMNMEEEDSGYQVTCAAWSWGIPATIVTAGITHHDHREAKGVFLRCPRETFLGDKSDPIVWSRILDSIFSDRSADNSIITALRIIGIVGKKVQPDLEYGRVCAAAICI